jgi:hypothetical protein
MEGLLLRYPRIHPCIVSELYETSESYLCNSIYEFITTINASTWENLTEGNPAITSMITAHGREGKLLENLYKISLFLLVDNIILVEASDLYNFYRFVTNISITIVPFKDPVTNSLQIRVDYITRVGGTSIRQTYRDLIRHLLIYKRGHKLGCQILSQGLCPHVSDRLPSKSTSVNNPSLKLLQHIVNRLNKTWINLLRGTNALLAADKKDPIDPKIL